MNHNVIALITRLEGTITELSRCIDYLKGRLLAYETSARRIIPESALAVTASLSCLLANGRKGFDALIDIGFPACTLTLKNVESSDLQGILVAFAGRLPTLATDIAWLTGHLRRLDDHEVMMLLDEEKVALLRVAVASFAAALGYAGVCHSVLDTWSEYAESFRSSAVPVAA